MKKQGGGLMSKIIINGGRKLVGEVRISGAKNAVLPIMAAALLTNGVCILRNVPRLDDVSVMLSVLEELSVRASWHKDVLRLDCSRVSPVAPSPDILGRIRASNLILGPLLGRFKEAEIGACGGCSIGSRPMDLHFAALEALGAKVLPLEAGYFAFAKGLRGNEVNLAFPSVGATENLLMAAALAEGRTVLRNAAAEPEIVDLAAFINAMGGKISGAGGKVITIEGVKRLNGAEYTVMPDRIETGTLLLAGAMCGGSLRLCGARAEHNAALLDALRQAGVDFTYSAADSPVSFIEVHSQGRRPRPLPEIVTASYPGFPTDMQPQLTAMLSLAQGRSLICERIFENRLAFVNELKKMGAAIQVQDNCAIIDGVARLHGAVVSAPDLRAGAALALAGLAAQGRTLIEQAEYIDRGYENFVEKLTALGADVTRDTARPNQPNYNAPLVNNAVNTVDALVV